jgi:heme-degrading monooxygenase HmoA
MNFAHSGSAPDRVPATTTVRTVLSMVVRPGAERELERVWAAAAPVIGAFPGSLGQTMMRGEHRRYVIFGDWVSAEALRAFERSDERRALSAALAPLRESARKRVLEPVNTTGRSGIRVVCRATIEPERQAGFEHAFRTVSSTVYGTPGHVRDELLRCLEDGTTYLLFAEWATEEQFRAWAGDPRHIEQSAPMLPFWAGTFQRELYEVRVDGRG